MVLLLRPKIPSMQSATPVSCTMFLSLSTQIHRSLDILHTWNDLVQTSFPIIISCSMCSDPCSPTDIVELLIHSDDLAGKAGTKSRCRARIRDS
jgi:hypothetical protein